MNKLIDNPIPKRLLGSTGVVVSLLGVGGYALGRLDVNLGVKIVRSAIDNGVNFLDNAWCYHDGRSEKIMGEALRDGYRDKVFLMTKNHGRDYETYKKQLNESLVRLGVDCIDLVQFHEIIHQGEPDRIFNEGAVDAAVEAKREGKIRFIGFSGHKWPGLFLEMLGKDFAWDTVQMPLNVFDYHYRSFTQHVLPVLLKRNIGVIGMKSVGGGFGGRFLKIKSFEAKELIRYSMSLPVSVLVSGMDSLEVLESNLSIASNFEGMSEGEKSELLSRAKQFSGDGKFEDYKTR